MKSIFRAVRFLLVITLVTGLMYPVMVHVFAVLCFPVQSQGSLLYEKGRVVGSRLIGQSFVDSAYFWPRPSATNFNAMPSGGSNLPPISDSLRKIIDLRRTAFRSANGLGNSDIIPNDMLFASGSGLDGDISPDAARLQIGRISRIRHMTNGQKTELASLVEHSIIPRQFGFLGKARVNVLQLNSELNRVAISK